MTENNARAKDRGQGGVGTGVSGGQFTEKTNTAPGPAANLEAPGAMQTGYRPKPGPEAAMFAMDAMEGLGEMWPNQSTHGSRTESYNPHGLDASTMTRMRAEVDAAETELKEYGRVTMKALSRMTRTEYGPNPIFRKRRVAQARAEADIAAYEEQQARIRLNEVHMRHEAEVDALKEISTREGSA